MIAAIFKYPLEIGLNHISLPHRAKVLCVHEQHGRPALWALCPQDGVPNFQRVFMVVPTGAVLTEESRFEYLGTCFCGSLVWHVFEDKMYAAG